MVDPTTEPADDLVSTVLQKTGLAALSYWPELQVDDPDYQLDDDVAWCLESATTLAPEERTALADLVARTIVDPTAHRGELYRRLRAISAGE